MRRDSNGHSAHINYRFGEFEFQADTNQLYKRGIRIRLQTKSLLMLEELLREHGQLVKREVLVEKLWPGTFVDYQSGLNTIVNRLRTALGDSAECPRYIETVPRLGYRFVQPVQEERCGCESLPAAEPVLAYLPATPVNLPPIEVDFSLATSKRPYVPYAAVGILGVALGIALASPHFSTFKSLKYHRLLLGSSVVLNARFVPSKDQVAVTASTGSGRQSFMVDLGHPKLDVRPAFQGAVASVSRTGELAVISPANKDSGQNSVLSRILPGGTPQAISSDVRAADWDGAGNTVALARAQSGEYVIEFPPKHVIYRSSAWIDSVRVAPRNGEIAFLEHAMHDDDAGHIRIIGSDGHTRIVTSDWSSVRGLAWSKTGSEVWTTACRTGLNRVLYAVSASTGKVREVSNSTSSLKLFDIGQSGSVLVSFEDERMTMLGSFAGEAREEDLTAFEYSHVEDLSADGNMILFTVFGQADCNNYRTYVYDHRTRKTNWVGTGRGLAISQDGKRVLTMNPITRDFLRVTELDSGSVSTIPGFGFTYQWAKFVPGGQELLAGGAFRGGPLGLFRQTLQGSRPESIGGVPYVDFVAVAPSGNLAAGVGGSRNMVILNYRIGQVLSDVPRRFPVGWSSDAKAVYLLKYDSLEDRIFRRELAKGSEDLWRVIGPSGATGFRGLGAIAAAPDAGTYAYSAAWEFSHLFVVDGWS
jgi:DNA-binding winged helix-turn-helix (wHTH) protein